MKRPSLCNVCQYPVHDPELPRAQHPRCALLLHLLTLRNAAWEQHQAPLPFSLTRCATSPRSPRRPQKLGTQTPQELRSPPRLYLVTPPKPKPGREILVDLGSPQLDLFEVA